MQAPIQIDKRILPVGMIILSVVAVYNVVYGYFSFDVFNYFSLIVSVIGVIGGYLYLKQGKPVGYWTELWIILQVPYIDKIIFATSTKPEYSDAIYDASQALKMAFYWGGAMEDCKYLIGINYLPLILIGLLMFFKIPYNK